MATTTNKITWTTQSNTTSSESVRLGDELWANRRFIIRAYGRHTDHYSGVKVGPYVTLHDTLTGQEANFATLAKAQFVAGEWLAMAPPNYRES